MMRPTGKQPLSVLEKRVPTNPRYANVQPKVQTGATMKNAVVLSDNTIARRRNEIFDRVSAGGVVALFSEAVPDAESVYKAISDSPVVSVVVPSELQASQASPPRKLLVFDLRPASDGPDATVLGAVRYPSGRILRDDVSVDLWRAKNERFFVFAEDDKSTAVAATLLVQKGWAQAVAISGGFLEISRILDAPSAPSTAPSAPSAPPSCKPSARK